MSCPHSRSADVTGWKNLAWIMKATGISKQKPELSPELLKALSEDCLCFERALHQKPILSIYEEIPSRVGKSGWNTRVARETVKFINRVVQELMVNSTKDHQTTAAQPSKRPEKEPQKGAEPKQNPNTETVLPPASTQALLRPLSDGPEPHTRSPSSSSVSGIHSSISNFASVRKDPQLRCIMIPYNRNHKFLGREKELKEIAKVLDSPTSHSHKSGNPHLPSFAISGLGGIGKTQLAIEFVYRHEASFDAVFWVQADGEESLYQSYAQIAIALGLINADSVEAKDKHFTRDMVLSWLALPVKQYRSHRKSVDKARWLVIFDSVEDPEMLDDFWPRGSSGSVLITSREPLAELQFYSTESGMTLPPFNIEDTQNFLLQITGRKNDKDDINHVQAVAKILGGMPLAVAQMAGYIVRMDLKFAEFVEKYNDPKSQQDLIRRLRKSTMPGYQHTIASVWGFENLKHSAYLLDVLSFFDPIGIPEYIMTSHGVNTDMEGFPQSETDYEEARAELLQSSLIVRDRSSKKLVVHTLIQDTARANMDDERYSIVFESALQLLSNVWPYEEEFGFMNETDRWAQCKELYKHMLRLQKLSARLTPPITLSKKHLQPPRVLLEAAWFSIMQADFSDTMPLVNMAESMWKAFEGDRKGFARQDQEVKEEFEEEMRLFHFHPGILNLHTNEPNMSLSHLKTFTGMLQQKLGNKPRGKDQRMGVAWCELGNSYLQNHCHDEAEQCFRFSAEALESLDDATSNTISMPLINLGFVLWLKGELDEAEEVFERTLADREAAYGKDDTVSFALGKLLLGLGNVKAAKQEMGESLVMHERALEQYIKTVGPFHHRTGDACVHVADHYLRLERREDSLKLLDQASNIFAGRPHFKPEEARLSYKRWKVLGALHRTKEADEAGRIAQERYRDIFPGEEARELEDMSDADFDKGIMFWSR
nr:hypothetical protein CFP56_67775 [Quercus suber]